jgi:putative transposase
MKRKRFAEGQIRAVLWEHEAGMKTGDLARKYGGIYVSDAKRLKLFEDEHSKLKKLLAELSLDKAMLNGDAR